MQSWVEEREAKKQRYLKRFAEAAKLVQQRYRERMERGTRIPSRIRQAQNLLTETPFQAPDKPQGRSIDWP